MKKTQSFEEALARLEQIVELLLAEQVTLDQSLDLYKEGAQLIEICDKKLGSAKLKIEQLFPKEVTENHDA